MAQFSTLLLDYDGTLAETRPAILRSLKEAFEKSGFQAPAPEILKDQLAHGGTLLTLFASVVPDASAQQTKQFVQHYRDYYPVADLAETHLYDDVLSTLSALKERGKELIIVSNKHAQTVRDSVERFKLNSFFSGIIASEPPYPHKPHPAVMDRVISLLPDKKKSEFLMVGDTAADLKFAKNVNIASCWVSYGHGWREECEKLSADFRIDHFKDILKIIA
ncbi:HAD family hydrolase [Swingsia samuiensis]|uniref:phosphoglycolate phosphatase n=1 Tax=Swingsia samuiensis TaxID=1293412 RepID=A0A4Y6UJ05_9PROT|nr:HAD family hydrolase [Swingsia samuiensis]QDH16608.1 HAD family hydrolase [Swingsia samuiensis]